MNIIAHRNHRKIMFLGLLLLPIFLHGCRNMEVNNNKFISSRLPYLEAKISPDFKYLSHFQWEEQRLSINKVSHNRIVSDSFFFIPNYLTKGIIPKYVYIKIEEIPDSRFVQPFSYTDQYIDVERNLRLGWYDFNVASGIAFPKQEVDIQLRNLIAEGFRMPECVLKRTAARVVSSDKRYISIVYGEDATLSGLACETWRDRANLTNEQKKYISVFNQRALSNFEIVASD